MKRWLQSLRTRARTATATIPDAPWAGVLAAYPFLADLPVGAREQLRQLTRAFLDRKEFHGADGLAITDAIAVAIAAQACLPVLQLRAPYDGIAWYDDFVGIVVHPGPVVARRQETDPDGVVHCFDEVLSGEAMQDGPVTRSWQDVAGAGESAQQGYNVVIHEFVHKIDMRDGEADGCPPLPTGFMGADTVAGARRAWKLAMQEHYLDFCDRLSLAERFGGQQPWLDPYGASAIDEFFAVASEAYFVSPDRFRREFPGLVPMMDAFFRPDPPTA